MGRQFTIAGQASFALRSEEAQAVYGALARLRAMARDEEAGEGLQQTQCADLLAQLIRRVDTLDTTVYLLEQVDASTRNFNPAALPCEIPVTDLDWAGNAELAVVQEYAPGGLLIPPEDVAAVNEALAGVVSIEQGRCAWRTRWGLVGAVAILGAAVLAGGAYIYDRAKKPRRR